MLNRLGVEVTYYQPDIAVEELATLFQPNTKVSLLCSKVLGVKGICSCAKSFP